MNNDLDTTLYVLLKLFLAAMNPELITIWLFYVVF